MKALRYQDGVIFIQISLIDSEIIAAILDQIHLINVWHLDDCFPTNHPLLTFERVIELKRPLLMRHDNAEDVDDEAIIIAITEQALIDLNGILAGALHAISIDESFIRDGIPIDYDAVGALADGVYAICCGLKTEDCIALIEKLCGITIPRFRFR